MIEPLPSIKLLLCASIFAVAGVTAATLDQRIPIIIDRFRYASVGRQHGINAGDTIA